jgi:quercetin dioxygenase-like cupin family protein
MSYLNTMAQAQPARKALLDVVVASQQLSKVEAKEITMSAGQAAPKHSHPCPVVGYVLSGKVLFQEEGEEKRTIAAGEAFYEPMDKVILHFDNASAEQPMTFLAFHLKEGDEALIKMVE